jgi:hypothetical protein
MGAKHFLQTKMHGAIRLIMESWQQWTKTSFARRLINPRSPMPRKITSIPRHEALDLGGISSRHSNDVVIIDAMYVPRADQINFPWNFGLGRAQRQPKLDIHTAHLHMNCNVTKSTVSPNTCCKCTKYSLHPSYWSCKKRWDERATRREIDTEMY